jgi:hypothetical protein
MEKRHHLLAADGRKTHEKVIDRRPAFEIVHKCLNWNSRSGEHGSAAQDVG